jgi:hypothetical protein
MIKIQDVMNTFDKYAIFEDKHIIEVLMNSVICNNMLTGINPVWLMIVAKSSGGKSMVLDPFKFVPGTMLIDDLTPNSFISGFGGGKGKVGKDSPSLLVQLPNGTFIISDFTLILKKSPEIRNPILGDFRKIYDGYLTKPKGTGTNLWQGRAGMICASTPEIYGMMEEARASGERFLYYIYNQPTDKAVAKKQREILKYQKNDKQINEEVGTMYNNYLQDLSDFIKKNGQQILDLSDEQHAIIDYAVEFLVNGKATVSVDKRTDKPDKMPQRAGVGRDKKQFLAALTGYLQMDNYNDNTPENTKVKQYRIDEIILKYAYSALNQERRKALEVLATGQKLSSSQIGSVRGFGMEKESVDKILTPLNSIGLIQKDTTNSTSFKWYIEDETTRNFILKCSALIVENAPQANGIIINPIVSNIMSQIKNKAFIDDEYEYHPDLPETNFNLTPEQLKKYEEEF